MSLLCSSKPPQPRRSGVGGESGNARRQGRHLPDGRGEGKVRYSAPGEVVVDVLHDGAGAEVVERPALGEQAGALQHAGAAAARRYRYGGPCD